MRFGDKFYQPRNLQAFEWVLNPHKYLYQFELDFHQVIQSS